MHLSRVLAVDCGASHVAVGRFRRGAAGRLSLIQFATEAVFPEGPGDEAWAAGIGAALSALGRREGLRGVCVIGVPGHVTLSKVVRIPRVAARQRRRIIRFEVGQYAPCALDELVWSHVVVAADENGQDLVITAARAGVINLLCARIRQVGFFATAVIPSWQALDARSGGGRAAAMAALVLGIGARTTHLVYRGPPRFFLRSMAMGGDMVTQEMAAELGVDAVEAESLKRRILDGTAGVPTDAPENMAVQIAAAHFVRRLGGEISRSLACACPAGGATRPAALHLTGGGSLLSALPRELEQTLQMRVERWEPPGLAADGLAGAGATGGLAITQLHELAGLAAYAAQRGAGSASLLSRPMRLALALRRWRPVMVAGALALLMGLLLASWHLRAVARETRQRADELEARIASLRRLEARNRANLTRLAELNRRIAALQRVAEARTSWIALLADLQERLVQLEDVWLERLQVLPAAGRGPAGRAGIPRCGGR
jgi:type IV pilus assembly protein PilM